MPIAADMRPIECLSLPFDSQQVDTTGLIGMIPSDADDDISRFLEPRRHRTAKYAYSHWLSHTLQYRLPPAF